MRDGATASVQAGVLIALAGFTDAIGLLALGGTFVSFMSGDTTQFGASLVTGGVHAGWLAVAVFVLFVFGTVVGTLLHARASRWPLVLLLETACFVVAALSGRVALCALAMGAQNAVPRRIHGTAPAKTFMTGTLVSFGQAFGEALLAHRGARREGFVTAAFHGLSWGCFLGGAIGGAAAWAGLGVAGALWVGVGVLVALMVSVVGQGRGLAAG